MDTVLPEVLVGLKDSRGEVVSSTLHTLADLVPLIGPEAVIGTSRRQVFVDSQPRVGVLYLGITPGCVRCSLVSWEVCGRLHLSVHNFGYMYYIMYMYIHRLVSLKEKGGRGTERVCSYMYIVHVPGVHCSYLIYS